MSDAEENEIFVSDLTLLRALSSDGEEFEDADYLTAFLKYQKLSKKVHTLAKFYADAQSKIDGTTELKDYFEDYFEDGRKLIGTSPTNSDAQEFLALIEALWLQGTTIIFFTDNNSLLTEVMALRPRGCACMSLKDLKLHIMKNHSEFYAAMSEYFS